MSFSLHISFSKLQSHTHSMKSLKNFLLLLITVLISSCSSPQREAGGPAIDGYCAVCYFTAGKAVKGSTEFSSDYDGKTYLFDSQKSKDLFETNPGKYVPQYDGYCAYGVSFGKKVPIDPTVFNVIDDKLYLNKSPSIGKTFNKDPKKYITRANSKWADIQ